MYAYLSLIVVWLPLITNQGHSIISPQQAQHPRFPHHYGGKRRLISEGSTRTWTEGGENSVTYIVGLGYINTEQ
jgi:hypothetical protein